MPRLDPAECRRRLAAARHAYLATAGGDGRPHVVPVTFAVVGIEGRAGWDVVSAVDHKPKTDDDARRLRRLRNLAANPRAAVLADAYDDDWDRLWWVRADGDVTVEDVVAPSAAGGAGGEVGAAATRAALAALADRYPQYRERPPAGPVVRVRVARWTGWEATATGARATPAAR
jgi:PPOX class probable F420-dependent enzyme